MIKLFSKKESKFNKKITILVVSILVLLFCCFIFAFFLFNAKTINTNEETIFVYEKESFQQLSDTLSAKNVIDKNSLSFQIFSRLLKLDKNIKVGCYAIESNTKIFKLARSLRNGEQKPIKLTINSVRSAEDLAKKISQKLLVSEQEILDYYNTLGYKYNNQLFFEILPDTYEFYWNTSPKNIFNNLHNIAEQWWNKHNNELIKIGLSKQEVIILASIVQQETTKNDEKPIIAGVYINRLRKNMLLQADPTVKFAIGDFTIKRIRLEHLKFDSPFNTYLYKGLPPCPICLPDISSIEAVLNYTSHHYLYFCAKEDFSGYHNFATTLQEHNLNANKYHKALNLRNIK